MEWLLEGVDEVTEKGVWSWRGERRLVDCGLGCVDEVMDWCRGADEVAVGEGFDEVSGGGG